MATTASRPKKHHKPDESAADSLQQAMKDVERIAERAGGDLRGSLDDAIERIRDVSGDLRKRAEDQAASLERTLDEATEDVRRELGRRAVRAQRSPEALNEISSEVRRRRGQLTRAKSGGAAKARR